MINFELYFFFEGWDGVGWGEIDTISRVTQLRMYFFLFLDMCLKYTDVPALYQILFFRCKSYVKELFYPNITFFSLTCRRGAPFIRAGGGGGGGEVNRIGCGQA